MAAGRALLLALILSQGAALADTPAPPSTDEQLPKMVVQGNAICSFGISLKCLGDASTKKITRILISDVVDKSRAQYIGLRPGDEILAVNGLKIAELRGGMSRDCDIMQLFVNRKKGEAIDLRIAVRVVKDLTLFASPRRWTTGRLDSVALGPLPGNQLLRTGLPAYLAGFSSASGSLVACHVTTCHFPSRSRSVPLFR